MLGAGARGGFTDYWENVAERRQKYYFEISSDFPLLRPWPVWWRAGTSMKLSAQRYFGDSRRNARQLNSLEASSRRWARWIIWR